MKSYSGASTLAIESIIRATGARVTPSRVQILSLLQSEQVPLSHGDVEGLIRKDDLPKIDRVTLYRVLDWLADIGLAHKAANLRGVFCFTAAKPNIEHARHVHFRCTSCGGVFCLDMPAPPSPKLPKEFRLTGVEMDIRGECPDCLYRHPRKARDFLGLSTSQ